MSLKASAWAWCVPVEKASERLVLLALADRADDKGYCYPSVKDICERTSLDRKAVFRALSTFSDRGVVTVQKRKGVHANSYTLAVDCPFLGSTEIGTSPNGNDPKEEQPLSPNGNDHCPQMGTTIVPKREQEPVNEPINNLPITDREDAPEGTLFPEQISPEKKKRTPTDRGSRLTIEHLPDTWRTFAEQTDPDLDSDVLWQNFFNYWTSVSGSKGVKKDWFATWRNFVLSFRNGHDWKRKPVLKAEVASATEYKPKFVQREKLQKDRVYGL